MKRRDFIAGLAASPSLAAAATRDRTDRRHRRNAGPVAGRHAAAPRTPLSITLLGTGTPAPSLERQSSGYLIEVGRDLIVWDHGPGAHHRLIESGHRSIDVTHAFFTHLHYDHCMDYGRLVLQRWDQGADRIADLKVYGPPPIARMTEQLFGADGIYGPDIRARDRASRAASTSFEARGGKLPRRAAGAAGHRDPRRFGRRRRRLEDHRRPRAARPALSRMPRVPARHQPRARSATPATAARATPSSSWRRAATC